MTPIYQDSQGHYCILADHPHSTTEQAIVDYIRLKDGNWEIWQRGSVTRNLLKTTELSIP